VVGRAAQLLALASLVLGSAGSVHAQYGATARVERPIPAGSEEDPTAAATTIDTEERGRPQETLGELLRESPGTRALSLGALGSYSTLSLRGTGGEHTRVVFDRMPLGRDGEAFDLSTIPVSTLDAVEVYRGGAPVGLGTGAIGGVLRLVPRLEEDPAGEVGIGVGSFGTRAVRLVGATGEQPGGVSLTTAVGYDGTEGDFPYVEDRTPLTPGDERETTRQNGNVDRGYGLGHFRADVGDGTLSAVGFGYGRTGGVPGPAVQPTIATRRTVARYGGMIGYAEDEHRDSPLTLGINGGATYERNRFTDPYGEIGLGRRATDDGLLVANGLANGVLELAEWFSAALVAGYRYERFDPEDALSQGVASSERHAGIAALEGIFSPRIGRTRVEVRPSARIEINHARLTEIRAGDAGRATDSTTAAPTFRLGAVAEVVRGVAIVGSVSSGVRLPTLTELFGDRGYLVGDTTLSPEHSVGGDLGAMAVGHWGPVRGRIEARGFALHVSDLIRYRRTSQYRAVPENVAEARILGVEGGLDLEVTEWVGLAGALTVMDAVDLESARDIPLRPTFSAYVRPRVMLGPLGWVSDLDLFVDLTHVGDSYADPANLVVTPGRTRVGAGMGLAVLDGRVRIDGVVTDLFDARGQDVLGFPLPGRSFFVDLTLRTGAR
jgi:iron complex outermembrane receptor protein